MVFTIKYFLALPGRVVKKNIVFLMKKIKITQIKSAINRPDTQKKTLNALGLRKLNKPVVVEGSPQLLGMIDKVKHLLSIEEVQA